MGWLRWNVRFAGISHFTLGHHAKDASRSYLYLAAALAVRDRLIEHWRETQELTNASDTRHVYYLSLEFLIGRSFTNAIYNLQLDEETSEVLHDYGVKLEEVAEEEHDAGLGNGGLGRLAACS